MACAAFAALVPLLGLLTDDPCSIRSVSIAVATYYSLMTYGNVSAIVRGLVLNDGSSVATAMGYLAPTAGLAVIAIWPYEPFIAWSSVTLIFFGYVLLSAMSRNTEY